MSFQAADSFDPKAWLVILGAAALVVAPSLLTGRKAFFAGLGDGPKKISKVYIRKYSDNGQRKAYVEWSDGSRTEGKPSNEHMKALIARAKREGLKVERETW